MPKRGGRRKKHRTHKEPEEDEKIPQCFIFQRGKLIYPLKQVLKEMKESLYPYAAMKLKENEKINLKAYLKAAGVYRVTHFLVFTSTAKNNYLKLIKTPYGPTFTFRINTFCSMDDVTEATPNAKQFAKLFYKPIAILNGFSALNEVKQPIEGENYPTKQHYQLLQTMISSMFPVIQMENVLICKFKNAKEKSDVVYFRHYHACSIPANINQNLKKILETNRVPNLRQFDNVSQFLIKNYNDDVLEIDEGFDQAEEDEAKTGDANNNKMQYAIKLDVSIKYDYNLIKEVGPRLALQLFKIQEGMMKGNVIYHRLIKKGAKETRDQKKKIRQKIYEKEERKQEQQERLMKKMEMKKTKQNEEENEEFEPESESEEQSQNEDE